MDEERESRQDSPEKEGNHKGKRHGANVRQAILDPLRPRLDLVTQCGVHTLLVSGVEREKNGTGIVSSVPSLPALCAAKVCDGHSAVASTLLSVRAQNSMR